MSENKEQKTQTQTKKSFGGGEKKFYEKKERPFNKNKTFGNKERYNSTTIIVKRINFKDLTEE
jgi:hypothetical protein